MERVVDKWWRATEKERELGAEADAKRYRSYQWRSLARAYPTRVEFDCDEEKMLREMSGYTGFPRSEIAREAVRYFYEEWYLKQPKESGVYYKCHEPMVWVDEEVKLDD